MTANAITVHASDHPLKSVTIFHSNTGAAEIVRTFPVSLRVSCVECPVWTQDMLINDTLPR